jgi:hypothetical protein
MSDYPQDAIARLLGKPGAGEPTFKDQTDVYRAAGCNPSNREIHKDVALALARGLEAQMVLDEVKQALAGLTARANGCRATGSPAAYEHAHELLSEALNRVCQGAQP